MRLATDLLTAAVSRLDEQSSSGEWVAARDLEDRFDEQTVTHILQWTPDVANVVRDLLAEAAVTAAMTEGDIPDWVDLTCDIAQKILDVPL